MRLKYSVPAIVLLIILPLLTNGDDEFTQEEKAAIIKVRERLDGVPIRDWQNRDDFLIKYLRARDLNVEAGAEMLYDTLKWRKYNKIDEILNETILELNPPIYLIEGYDKEGYPLMFFASTHVDLRKLLVQGLREKVIRYWYQVLEKGLLSVRNAPKLPNGKNVTKTTTILDLHGYNLRQHFCLECAGVYQEWFIGLEKYYPEAMRHFVVLNIPRTAKQLIELIRPLLSSSTDKALKLFPPDRNEYSKFLRGIINEKELPYRFGGIKRTSALG